MKKREELQPKKDEVKLNPFTTFIIVVLLIILGCAGVYLLLDAFGVNVKSYLDGSYKTTVVNNRTTSSTTINNNPGFKTTDSTSRKSTNTTSKNSPGFVTTTKRKTSGNVVITTTKKDQTTTTKKGSSSSITWIDIEGDTNMVAVGGVAYLSVLVYPESALNKNVTWSSSNPGVLSVSQSGKITGKKVGTSIITVTSEDGGKKATALIKVVAPSDVVKVKSVSLANKEATIRVGNTITLVSTVSPRDATNPNVTWSSSNKNIAIVDAQGVVTAKNPGTVTITVKTSDGGKTATCKITVIS